VAAALYLVSCLLTAHLLCPCLCAAHHTTCTQAVAARTQRRAASTMADQEGAAEHKPAQPKQEGTVINLIVKDQMGSEVHFKVKTHTKLEKVGWVWWRVRRRAHATCNFPT
jgi:hypothetical protein